MNDHDALRKDPLLGAVLGRLEKRRDDCEPLAGKSTLNRLELAAAARLDRKHRKVVAEPAIPCGGPDRTQELCPQTDA